jgi:hypothetical protein
MSIHTMPYRLQALFSCKAVMAIFLILPFLLSTTNAQGIAPGGCVTGGSTLPSNNFNSNSSLFRANNFRPFSAQSTAASMKAQQLRVAFQKVGTEMDNSLSEGNLVSGFRQYLNYTNKAQQYQKQLPDISSELFSTRNRITVVLNYAVNNAKRVTEKSPEDEVALMTLVEIANMPEIAVPSRTARQCLENLKDSKAYQKTLAEFRQKYQIESLAPEATSSSPGELQGVTKVLSRKNQ